MYVVVLPATRRCFHLPAVAGHVIGDAAPELPLLGLAPFYDLASLLTPAIQAKIDAALAGMKAGTLDPCKPAACDKP